MTEPLQAMLVCGGSFHDFDYARLQLLQLLYDLGNIRTHVAADYRDSAILDKADLVVSYTCQVTPTSDECAAIRRFVERGGRWLALHSSNAFAEACPLPQTLGSRFAGHPPYGRFSVTVTQPDDPLMQGIAPFDVDDELYVMDVEPGIEILLETSWGGVTQLGKTVPAARRPLLYRFAVGQGGVVYIALAHCNREFDARPFREQVPVRRGPWEQPAFRELTKRSLAWAARRV